MDTFRADMHCHTTCSDGSESPEQIVRLAKKSGLSALAVTDHDTIAAYPEIFSFAREVNLEMISAVEFTSMYKQTNIDVLAYAFSIENPTIQEFCREHTRARQERNQEILNLLADKKIFVSVQEIEKIEANSSSHKSIGRPHMAQVMVNKGYVSTTKEAFDKYLAEGQPCYTPGKTFSTEETLDVIHQCHGIAIIAHPYLIKNHEVIPDLFKLDFDGIECFYANYPPEQKWINEAKGKNWLITGGSDFHGTVKPTIQLGCSWTNEETFRILQKRFIENRDKK